MMKVVCPYTELNPATEYVLNIEPQTEVKFVDVSGWEEAYFWLMYKYWKQGETFIVVEHDIVPWPGALRSLDRCEAPLCAYMAPHAPMIEDFSYGLGLVKYGKALMDKFPDHLDNPTTRVWYNVAYELTDRLNKAGVEYHYHSPPVIHINSKRFP